MIDESPGSPRRGSSAWFLAVGGLASLVHWAVVVALVEADAVRPLLANVAGWMVAFGMSFAGHHLLSFRGHSTPAMLAALRFFVISATGFVLNQAAYAVLIAKTSVSYALLLVVVLAGVAAATYVAGRWWAFRHRPEE